MANNKNPSQEIKKPRKRGPLFGIERSIPKSPGRPRIPPEVKAERKEARQILKELAPGMAARIAELAHHEDPDISIKACKVGLDKILPNLEEVETHDDRPLQQFSDEHLTQRLAELNARASSHSDGIGAPAK